MLQKVRTFEMQDVEKVAQIFENVPDGWSEKALRDSLANDSIKSFVLEVRESNTPAKTLYEKLGFELIGTRKNFYSNPKEAALIYKLDL